MGAADRCRAVRTRPAPPAPIEGEASASHRPRDPLAISARWADVLRRLRWPDGRADLHEREGVSNALLHLRHASPRRSPDMFDKVPADLLEQHIIKLIKDDLARLRDDAGL